MLPLFLALLLLPAAPNSHAKSAEPARPESGLVSFEPSAWENEIPERYRLKAGNFPYRLREKACLTNSGTVVSELELASPVVTRFSENNTVHGVYYRPAGQGRCPAAVVLDILDGSQRVSRTEAAYLASHGIAALCIDMPYYGPRRPAGMKYRLLSPDYPRTMEAVRQCVLDVRLAAAWLGDRPEIDKDRIGVVGTSLGSFMAALTAEMEPRVSRVAILLGGGGLVEAYYDDPRAEPVRRMWEALGGTRDKLATLVAPADPLTFAARLRGRRVLIIAGRHDQVVPPAMAKRLCEAAGHPPLKWFDCDHFTAVLYFVPAMREMVALFRAD